MRRIRHAAAVGAAVAVISLFSTPVAGAAPRAEEPPRATFSALHGLADHLSDLFGGWIQSVLAATNAMGDPDG